MKGIADMPENRDMLGYRRRPITVSNSRSSSTDQILEEHTLGVAEVLKDRPYHKVDQDQEAGKSSVGDCNHLAHVLVLQSECV